MHNIISRVPISFYKDHKYFRHIVEILSNHPGEDALLALHAAVLTHGSTILSVGMNKPKSNGLVRAYAPHDRMTIHAEVDCILKARKKHDLTGTTIYVGRKLKRHDLFSMSKPCATCHAIMKQYGVRHVFYTNEFGSIEYFDTRKEYIKDPLWHVLKEV